VELTINIIRDLTLNESCVLTGDLSQLSSVSGCIELSTVTEQSASEVSLTTDRKCSSTHVSQNLADVKLMNANQPSIRSVPVGVNSVNAVNAVDVKDSVNVATCKDLVSSAALSSQVSCTGSFIAPLPVSRLHQTQTPAAVCSSSVLNSLQHGTNYYHLVQTGQPVLEVTSSSLHPMLPNQTVPFKVPF